MLNVLAWVGVLTLGALLFLVIVAIIGWAIFWMQNGGRDE